MSAPLRIIAHRVAWPSHAERPERSGLRLRWDAFDETGDLLAASTEWPLADGALALFRGGADPETLVTMRHEGATSDCIEPIPLRVPAKLGARRETRAASALLRLRRKAHREETYEATRMGGEGQSEDERGINPEFRLGSLP
ncbi:MAG: hypothetical protein ACE37J_04970 [Pikeienuella sp.]|uniref:hypothetical protein n=1 Tax=Pikeienuella sp. TaxID=2831957 RepID=UPI00391BADBF